MSTTHQYRLKHSSVTAYQIPQASDLNAVHQVPLWVIRGFLDGTIRGLQHEEGLEVLISGEYQKVTPGNWLVQTFATDPQPFKVFSDSDFREQFEALPMPLEVRR
jgi:hypothetical protein